jgi:glycosyltransferase involved in cell wall biosynthesis
MKIYLIYEFLSEQGGLERELINHARFLQEEGHEVEILTCYLDKKLLKVMPFDGIKITEISKFKTNSEILNLLLCFLGFNKLKNINPDAFLSYSFPCNFLIRNKKQKKINYINHVPHFLYLSFKEKLEWANSTHGIKRWATVIMSFLIGSILKKIDKNLIKKNNLNFVNSIFTKKNIEKIYKIKTVVSYPPISQEFSNNKIINSENFIFSSSRIIPDKKYDWLIKSLSYTKNKFPLILAGSIEGKYRNKLISLAKENKVEINFLGKLNTQELIKYYSNARVFTFPAPKEDFGLVPAESLACGTPVIAWNDGAGQTEQIIDGLNGYLSKPYSIKDFAKKIDLCLDNNLKEENRKEIINSSKKFSAKEVKKGFIMELNKLLKII